VATLSVGPALLSTSTSTPALLASGSPPPPAATATLLSGRAPRLPRQPVHFVTNGDREHPRVALTFDMCQAPQLPSQFDQGIYDALREAEAPATFFLGGDWMRTHVTETRLLAAEPLFELGNHSWSHPDMRELDEAQMTREVLRTQDLMYQITGRQTLLWRFPAGLYNDLALSVVAFQGLYSIQWDVVTADPVPDNSAENIQRLVRERVQNGSIIVMHGNGRGWHTAEALPGMIEYLRDEGYCLVTVSQLIGLAPLPESCGG
jgi:peptidoglycan/xylan/chitin deacetylase (PgdA/CDA1 family)